eukprot:58181-Prorocentrum_minimum.AAC.1
MCHTAGSQGLHMCHTAGSQGLHMCHTCQAGPAASNPMFRTVYSRAKLTFDWLAAVHIWSGLRQSSPPQGTTTRAVELPASRATPSVTVRSAGQQVA